MLAFQLECEVVREMAALMISTEKPESVGVPDLQRPEVQNTLNTEVASIDVISQEKVSRIRRITANFEQLHQVEVLTVNVTTDCNRRIHLEQVWLFPENFGTLIDNE